MYRQIIDSKIGVDSKKVSEIKNEGVWVLYVIRYESKRKMKRNNKN